MGFIDYIKLLRPPLLFLGVLAPFSLMVHYGKWGGMEGWFILLAIAFGNTAFNIFNEVTDKEADKILKPWKPIPSGKVNPRFARLVGYISLAISYIFICLLSFYYNLLYLYLGVAGYITGMIYNHLQMRDLGGNIALGLTYGIAAYIATYPEGRLFVFGWMLLVIGFNIAVQLQDVEGDRKAGIYTIPQQIGINPSRILSAMLVIFSLPFFYLELSSCPLQFMCFMFVAYCVVLGVLINKERDYERIVRFWGRLFMILGFLGLLL